jgi:hypothetical protein
MVGLSLVAVFAIAAVAATSASALEWGKCEAKAGGNYTGPNCGKTEKAKPKGTGTYEWLKASQVGEKRVAEGKSKNVPFTGKSVGGGGLLTSGLRECEVEGEPKTIRTTRKKCAEVGTEERVKESETLNVECAAENSTGEASGTNSVANVHVTFTGCAAFGVFPCKTVGSKEGEILTTTLKGKLGWINKAAKEVGVLLEPAKKHGSFATFECQEELFVNVGVGSKTTGAEYTNSGCSGLCPGTTPEEESKGGYDQILSPIVPVNKMTNTFEQKYTIESEYPFKNIPDHFEGKHLSALEDTFDVEFSGITGASQWSGAGEVITNVNTPEEEGEIKA